MLKPDPPKDYLEIPSFFYKIFCFNLPHHRLPVWMQISFLTKNQNNSARDGIRTQELLRDQALNLTPLTWLGYPRACIHYV